MTKDEILTGIHSAECKPELKAHIELVDKALDRNECDYSAEDWAEISDSVGQRLKYINARVLH